MAEEKSEPAESDKRDWFSHVLSVFPATQFCDVNEAFHGLGLTHSSSGWHNLAEANLDVLESCAAENLQLIKQLFGFSADRLDVVLSQLKDDIAQKKPDIYITLSQTIDDRRRVTTCLSAQIPKMLKLSSVCQLKNDAWTHRLLVPAKVSSSLINHITEFIHLYIQTCNCDHSVNKKKLFQLRHELESAFKAEQ
jgi:hypothetical protein